MTSVGVLASSVVTSVCTSVLREPFDNLAAWTLAGTPTIVAGRTGTAAQMSSSGQAARYAIPAPAQSDYITAGFAWRTNSLTNSPHILQLAGNANNILHNSLAVATDGTLSIYRGTKAGTVLSSSAAGAVAINTWYYIEVQVRLHDTLGSATVRINGSPVITATNVDTMTTGATTFDTVRVVADVSTISLFDDLYLTTGAGCAFQGDQVITNTGPDVLLEPFNNLTAWTLTGTPTIVAGRNGTCCQCVSSGATFPSYTIPAAAESATVTIGFAYKVASLAFAVHPLMLLSDAGATTHTTLRILTTGAIAVALGAQAGGAVVGGTSATGLVAINTWNYFEVQVTLHDTVGAAKVRLNGTEVINTSGIDTKNAGTKTVYDTVRLTTQSTTSTTHQWDDLYVTMGAGAAFKGDITIP